MPLAHTAASAPYGYRTTLAKPDLIAIRDLLVSTSVFNDEEVMVAIELAEDALTKQDKSDYHFVLAEFSGRSEATTSEQGQAQPARRQEAKPLSANKILLGYTCYGRIPFTDGRYDLYWIATTHAVRGVASTLLAHTEERIRSAGGKHLYAETSSRMPYAPAHAFYVKNGFIRTAVLKDFYRDGDDKLIFNKIL